MDYETTRIVNVLLFTVTPVVSALGFVGNILTILVLSRMGLGKPSNIILVALALSDLCVVLGSNSPSLVNVLGPLMKTKAGYIIHTMALCMQVFGTIVSMVMPVLICLERLIAVFFPLRFSRLVTPRRTLACVGLLMLYGLVEPVMQQSYHLYSLFEMVWTLPDNTTAKFIAYNYNRIGMQMYYHSIKVTEINSILKGPVSLSLVLAGCIAIGIQLSITLRRRRKMTTASQHTGYKTTITLLVICVSFLIFGGSIYFIELLTNATGAAITRNIYRQGRWVIVLHFGRRVFLALNCSINFLIYVATNYNFRLYLQETFLGKCKLPGRDLQKQ